MAYRSRVRLPPRRPGVLAAAAVTLLALLAPLAPLTPAQAAAPGSAPGSVPPGATTRQAAPKRLITYTEWDTTRQLARGDRSGVVMDGGRLVLGRPAGRRTYAGRSYDRGSWTSPWVRHHTFTELVASWSARTPGDSWVEVEVRGRRPAGPTSWDVLARWTSGDTHLERRTVSGQGDEGTSVAVDTWRAPAGLTTYQLRVTLLRRTSTRAAPSVDVVGAMASRVPSTASATSAPGPARGRGMRVPPYSQMIHRGHYPQWGNGGEAWCSPTSTSMVLGWYGALPPARSYGWVPSGHPNPFVDHAARSVYDYAYDGAGNWPFGTAYAASLAGRAFVTRLRSMREAEEFVVARIPLVISIAFRAGELDGAPISSSNGHLLVVVGFTRSGDVVVNDPAAPTNGSVRRTYDRGQLERAWLNASGGLTYVIRDAEHPLPAGPASNW